MKQVPDIAYGDYVKVACHLNKSKVEYSLAFVLGNTSTVLVVCLPEQREKVEYLQRCALFEEDEHKRSELETLIRVKYQVLIPWKDVDSLRKRREGRVMI